MGIGGWLMAKKYLEFTDIELIQEIHRIEHLLTTNKKPLTHRQNKIYLQKLHNEWGRRKNDK